jgi:hypothetical protein
MKWLLIVTLWCSAALAQTKPAPSPAKVTFRDDGITLVNGKPYFPIGIYVYELNTNVMADCHEHQFNTIVGNAFEPDKLDYLRDHGMMAVPIVHGDWVAKGKDHPAMLAWCLTDEPEGRLKPEETKKLYEELKKKDPNHPIGIDHYLFEALAQYKDSTDFTMTDVYPILKDHDGLIHNVGVFIDEARRVHNNPNWPHWAYIQDFGGPDTEGGKWAQPLPHEVRCMTFIALVHRAGAIMYFSYWPKAPTTWNSITDLNKDLHRIEPWILARGEEVPAKTDLPAVQVRAKKIGNSWIVMAVNVKPKFHDMKLTIEGLPDGRLRHAFENRQLRTKGGVIEDRIAPYGVQVYLLGEEPKVE